MFRSAIRDNVAAVNQGIALLAGLPAERYCERAPACFNSSAGGHLRHVIEHYDSFLLGWERREIDYESRPRDAQVENDPAYASGRLEAIVAALNALTVGGVDRAVRVRAETAPEGTADAWCDSSALRELEFLLSHTVHHYALIAVVCGQVGQAVPKDFGMAPSTLRFLQASAAACAR